MQSFLHHGVPRSRSIWIVLVLLSAGRFAASQAAPVPARAAPLLLPSAVAYDLVGNLYIAEAQRHQVRKVDTLGNIAGVAGDGTQGFSGDGGPATSAQLNSPQGVALDGDGNLYVADSGNNRVRRVDRSSGVIQTIAGNGRAAFAGDGGPAQNASLDLPRSLCLDGTGRILYIADSRNHRIRRIDLTTGVIATVTGNGVQGYSGDGALATSAELDSPESIALDPAGNLYIADTHNSRIRRVAADTQVITTLFGNGSVSATNALALPRGISSDAQGNLYIADSGSHRLLRVDHTSRAVTVAAGSTPQGFAGDGGAATAAALDSPRATAVSPAGLVAIADTGNARVRQLTADSAPDSLIQTIAGLGVTEPSVLSLSAPAAVPYGSGTLTASLNAGWGASGQVSFFEIGDTSSTLIGVSRLAAGTATLNLAAFSAGQHRLMATYSGDATHAATQTPASTIAVTPLTLIAAPSPATTTYGSPIPPLSGSLAGLLPQDTSRVTASFKAAATSLSPAGAYPISVALAGEGAANYSLQASAADLTIQQANSSILLRDITTDAGLPISLAVQVNSTTTGTPSGVVLLLDNGAAVQQTALSAAGTTVFAPLTLASGSHALSATYPGDQNFLASTSPQLTRSVAPSPTPAVDFTVASTGASSQTLPSGGSVSYTLSVQTTGGGFSSPIALSVSGLPAFTSASFNPRYLPPGGAAATAVTLAVSSSAASARSAPARNWPLYPSALALSLPLVGFLRRRRARHLRVPTLTAAILATCLTSSLIGCGDRINTAGQTSAAPQSYTLTVKGTATDRKGAPVERTVNVTLLTSAH